MSLFECPLLSQRRDFPNLFQDHMGYKEENLFDPVEGTQKGILFCEEMDYLLSHLDSQVRMWRLTLSSWQGPLYYFYKSQNQVLN